VSAKETERERERERERGNSKCFCVRIVQEMSLADIVQNLIILMKQI
jgi:hypothetical protein